MAWWIIIGIVVTYIILDIRVKYLNIRDIKDLQEKVKLLTSKVSHLSSLKNIDVLATQQRMDYFQQILNDVMGMNVYVAPEGYDEEPEHSYGIDGGQETLEEMIERDRLENPTE